MTCKKCGRNVVYFGTVGLGGEWAAWECGKCGGIFCGACCVPKDAPRAQTAEDLAAILRRRRCPTDCPGGIELLKPGELEAREEALKPAPFSGAFVGALLFGFIGLVTGKDYGITIGIVLGLIIGAWLGSKGSRGGK